MPSTAGIVASGSAQLDQWLRANLIAFDERRSSPLTNLGTLGAAGDATATGTRRLVNTGSGAVVQLPGVIGNFLSVPAAAGGPLDITGPIFIGAEVALTDWTPSTRQTIAAKWNGSLPGSSWQFAVNTSAGPDTAGALQFRWYSASNVLTTVSTGLTAVGAVDGSWRFVGIDLGASAAQFYTSDDGATWTPLGSPVATAGVPDIASNSTDIRFGQRDTEPMGGGVRRGIIRAGGIGGTTVLDIDPSVLTDDGATSFTATTGQTVTINRGTGAAYKTATVLPGSAKRLFNGTSSDFLAMGDVADIGAGDSCSVWALVRQWATPVSNGRYWSKWDGSSGAGWHLSSNGTALTVNGYVDDGPDSATAVTPAMTAGGLSLIGFTLDRSTNLLTPYMNGTAGTAVSASSIGDLTNTEILYYGRNAANNANQAHESPLRGIYPGALTAAQWAAFRDALLVPERAAA